MTGSPPNFWILFSGCPNWRFPVSAPMHTWGIPSLQPWQGVRLWKNAWVLALPSHSPASYFPAMCCGAAHFWTLLNGALVWPDSSPLLHFPSNLPAQPVRLPPESCQDFILFLHGSTFPSTLPNNSNILLYGTFYVSLPPCLVFAPYTVYSLPECCMSKLGFLCSRQNMSFSASVEWHLGP